MGTRFSVSGKSGQPTNFSLLSDVLSHNPADSSGGIGGLTLNTPLSTFPLKDEWKFLYRKPIIFHDGFRLFTSTIVNMNVTNVNELTFVSEHPSRTLQSFGTVEPFQGPIRSALSHIINSVNSGINAFFSVDIPYIDVVVPAHYGSIWNFLKQFLVVHNLEVVMESGYYVTFRPIRTAGSVEVVPNATGSSESVTGDQVATQVAVEYYGNEYVVNGTVFPIAGEDPNVISVNAGEVAVVELATKTGMSSVNQPVPADFLGGDYTGEGTLGAYTIAGDDGLGIAAASWTAAGGKVEAVLKENDPYTIILTVTAPTAGVLATPDARNTAAPYHLAMTDGNLYSRLFLTGTGVRTSVNTLTLNTGATGDFSEQGVGYTLTNPCVGTLSEAYNMGLRVSQAYSGASISTERTSAGLTSYFFSDFPGVRLKDPEMYYRVNSVNYSKGVTQLSAYNDTTFEDFNDKWAGATFADFNTQWAGKKFQDFAIAPLRKS